MASTATRWLPRQPGTITPTNAVVARLQQNGVARLQQNGVARLLEDNVTTPKETTSWSSS